MVKMSTAKVFKNLISFNDINSIINFYQSQDEQHTEKGIVNKNLEYHIPDSFIFEILKPYMDIVVGPAHEFSTGSYKSSKNPYIIHVDSRTQHTTYPDCMLFDEGLVKLNKAVLIPLVEGPEFRTVAFEVWSDRNPTPQDIKLHRTEKNHLLPEHFDHDKNFNDINFLKVAIDYQWQLGDIFTWDRNQWHMSNNFYKLGKVKTFLILFMA